MQSVESMQVGANRNIFVSLFIRTLATLPKPLAKLPLTEIHQKPIYPVRASTNTTQKNIIPPVCNRTRNCRYCPYINTSGTLTSTTNRNIFQCMQKVTCQSSNSNYIITCKNCCVQYVGQTKNHHLTRFQGHIFDIMHA